MSVPNISSWSDKNEHKVFKCNAKSATKHQFSILLIGNTTWTSQLSDVLIEYHSNNHVSKIEVHKSISVKSALSTLPNIYADLVVILLDSRKNDCLVEAEMNLLALEPALLCGRTMLVNPTRNLKRKNMAVSYENINRLKQKYNLLIIHGDIEFKRNSRLSRITVGKIISDLKTMYFNRITHSYVLYKYLSITCLIRFSGNETVLRITAQVFNRSESTYLTILNC